MKKLLFLFCLLSYFSVFSQSHRHPEYENGETTSKSNFHHRLVVGTLFPLRVHGGYEMQWKGLQLGFFVGITPQKYQDLVFELLQKTRPAYQRELTYLQSVAQSKMQYGGELKLNIGKNFSIGGTIQIFNYSLIDTPKQITEGLLPEEAANINASLQGSNEARAAYETKKVEAFMNTIVAGPTLEKLFWLNPKETVFIRFKATYWFLINRQNDLTSQDFTPLEQSAIDSFRPKFLSKIDNVSSQLQAPSFGVELGVAF